jgi:hypothetical protein
VSSVGEGVVVAAFGYRFQVKLRPNIGRKTPNPRRVRVPSGSVRARPGMRKVHRQAAAPDAAVSRRFCCTFRVNLRRGNRFRSAEACWTTSGVEDSNDWPTPGEDS